MRSTSLIVGAFFVRNPHHRFNRARMPLHDWWKRLMPSNLLPKPTVMPSFMQISLCGNLLTFRAAWHWRWIAFKFTDGITHDRINHRRFRFPRHQHHRAHPRIEEIFDRQHMDRGGHTRAIYSDQPL